MTYLPQTYALYRSGHVKVNVYVSVSDHSATFAYIPKRYYAFAWVIDRVPVFVTD